MCSNACSEIRFRIERATFSAAARSVSIVTYWSSQLISKPGAPESGLVFFACGALMQGGQQTFKLPSKS